MSEGVTQALVKRKKTKDPASEHPCVIAYTSWHYVFVGVQAAGYR